MRHSDPTSSAPSWDIRSLGEVDLPELVQLDNAAFHVDPPADYLADVVLPMLEVPRITGVRDDMAGGTLAGHGGDSVQAMTFPGDRVHPVAAVTYVAVRAGWRRRGTEHLRAHLTRNDAGWQDGSPLAGWTTRCRTLADRTKPHADPARSRVATPQIELHVRDLAACFVGGTRRALVAADQVSGDPDALDRLGLALSTPVAPWCPEGF